MALDTWNFEKVDGDTSNLHFKNNTNLPNSITIQEGARVMFLNNRLFEHNICNGTIGVITKSIDRNNVEVTFPTNENIVKINVQKNTANFEINGVHASRY